MTRNRKPYDQAFKYLSETAPRALLAMLGALAADAPATVTRLPQELIVSTLIPDAIYLVERDGQHEIFHIEARTRYDPPIPARLLDYAVRLRITYDLPVRTFLLPLTKRGVPVPCARRNIPGGGIPGEMSGVFAASFDVRLRSGGLTHATSRVGAGQPFRPMSGGIDELQPIVQAILTLVEARRLGQSGVEGGIVRRDFGEEFGWSTGELVGGRKPPQSALVIPRLGEVESGFVVALTGGEILSWT